MGATANYLTLTLTLTLTLSLSLTLLGAPYTTFYSIYSA